VILDATLLNNSPHDCAQELAAAGVRLLQYRHKTASRGIAGDFAGTRLFAKFPWSFFGCNDRPISCLAGPRACTSGKRIWSRSRRVPSSETKCGSTSTHNMEQFRRVAATLCGLHCCRTHFPTTSKSNPDPVVGLELIRQCAISLRSRLWPSRYYARARGFGD